MEASKLVVSAPDKLIRLDLSTREWKTGVQISPIQQQNELKRTKKIESFQSETGSSNPMFDMTNMQDYLNYQHPSQAIQATFAPNLAPPATSPSQIAASNDTTTATSQLLMAGDDVQMSELSNQQKEQRQQQHLAATICDQQQQQQLYHQNQNLNQQPEQIAQQPQPQPQRHLFSVLIDNKTIKGEFILFASLGLGFSRPFNICGHKNRVRMNTTRNKTLTSGSDLVSLGPKCESLLW